MGQNQNENFGRNEDMNKLKATGALTYSMSSYAPCEAGWQLTKSQICDIIKNQTKAFLDDVQTVTLEINHKSGMISAFVWIPRNSRHICNNDLKGNNSAINRSMTRYSSEIKEYMKKFCLDGDARIVQEEDGMPLAGIRVAIDRFMKIEFDENGNQYAEKYGTKNQKKARIELTCNFKKGDDGRFGAPGEGVEQDE